MNEITRAKGRVLDKPVIPQADDEGIAQLYHHINKHLETAYLTLNISDKLRYFQAISDSVHKLSTRVPFTNIATDIKVHADDHLRTFGKPSQTTVVTAKRRTKTVHFWDEHPVPGVVEHPGPLLLFASSICASCDTE